MSASRLIYDGIEIGYIKTNSFRQEPIYDSSHTDLLYQKITISVTGTINYNAQARGTLPIPSKVINNKTGGYPTIGCYAAAEIVAIRQRLLTPRGSLIYIVDGVELVHSPLDNKIRDEANGPKPIRFDVVKIDGGKTLMVEFEIETYINECNEQNCTYPTVTRQAFSKNILSNRFSITDSMDANYLSTRTISGIIVLSGVNNDPNVALLTETIKNSILVPAIPPNWKRESISIVQEVDGLTYRYNIIDKQLQYAMPGKCVSIDAQYTQTFGLLGAGMVQNEMTCTVQGEPNAEYQDLLKIAMRVIYSRVYPTNLNATKEDEKKYGTEIMEGGSIHEDIFNRKITIKIKTKRAPNETLDEHGLNILTHRLGLPIPVEDIENNKARAPENYKTYLIACTLALPCGTSYMRQYPQDKVGKQKEEPEVIVYPTPPPSRYQDEQKWNTNQTQAAYTNETKTELAFETDHHTHQMSVAIPGAQAQFATVAAPTTIRKVRWVTMRNNQLPEMPHPEMNDSNMVLLKSWVYAATPILAEDGRTWLYTTHGEYWYGQYKAYDYGTIELPRNPLHKGTPGLGQNLIPAQQFKRDILSRYA